MKKVYSEEDLVKNLSLYYLNRHLHKKPMKRYHSEIDSSSLHEREKYRKKSEILLLNAFLHHYPELKLENLICESPDFIAKFNGKTIGIELTEVINHLEIKKIESLMNRIFRQTEIRLENEDLAAYRGVYFFEFHSLSGDDLADRHEEIVESLCKTVRRGKPSGAVKKMRKTPHRRNVFITHEYCLNLFDELSSEKIVQLINKKNEKYPYYDQSVDECWLVIVSDMNSLASRYTFIKNQEQLEAVQSPFHKILHLENLCGNLTTIK